MSRKRSKDDVISKSSSSSLASLKKTHKNVSILPKLFAWSHEKPRANSEYQDGKFNEAHNEIAPELRVIGGLGQFRCLAKTKVQRQRLINRPTQVQKVTHTRNKLLPNFPLTAELRPVVCPQEQQPNNITEHVERVKFVENLPPSSTSSSLLSHENNTKKNFNHQNPFNLDLSGLSEYQRQKSAADDVEKRKNFQSIRRTMETKLLKTEGKERIKQQERDEKFGFPKLFNVCNDSGSEQEKKELETGEKRLKLTFSSHKFNFPTSFHINLKSFLHFST